MEDKSDLTMQLAKTGSEGKSIVSHQESFSQEESQSESSRQVGNAKIKEKSATFQSQAAAEVIEKTGTSTVSKTVQSSFTSSKERSPKIGDESNEEMTSEAKVNELIKSFETSQMAIAPNIVKTEVEIVLKEPNSTSSKALELINKFIDVPPPPEAENPQMEEKQTVETETVNEPAPQDPIDIEMIQLSKELEELKKEEERCEKTYVTRQTSTSSLEEAFVKRLEERRYKNVQEMLSDCLPPLFKVKKPEAVPPGNLLHLLQSVQIAQELNSVLKQSKKEEQNETDDANIPKDDSSGRDNKPIDLEKLFTPATDSGEVTPSRNRKMYASSSFYSPFHPTVEDQVELARRISSSLCDISNKQSKGQSMYVNRMKRSVKWVHGGEENETHENSYTATNEEINYAAPICETDSAKNPLKLVMNPHGKVQDLNSLTKQGLIIQPPLSPELCFDLVKDLNTTKGKGAELFAKRRKKSEKWVVDENTVKQTSTATNFQRQTSQTTEKTLNASNQQREQQMQKIQEIKGRFNQPKLKLVKSPWDAALETGSVDAAFQELPPLFAEPPIPWTAKINETTMKPLDPKKTEIRKYGGSRSDLYLPNIPKGWTSTQFGISPYGYSQMPGMGPSSASCHDLSQLNTKTNLTYPKPPFLLDSTTPKPALKKRETDLPMKEQKVTFLESEILNKKVKTETVPNVRTVENEIETIQTQIKNIDDEVGVKKLDQTTNESFSEIKPEKKDEDGDDKKSKPAYFVIGAVPLFKGSEESKTNLLLHKELKSKLPAKKQKRSQMSKTGLVSHSVPVTNKTTTQYNSQYPEHKLDGNMMEPPKQKSQPLPQLPALPCRPMADPSTTYSSHQQYPKLWDHTSWNNYNTAPRGWKQNLDYYRPVTFTPSYKLPGYYTEY